MKHTDFVSLNKHFEKSYGVNFDREEMSVQDHLEFVTSCYDIYNSTYMVRDVFKSEYSDMRKYDGKRFEIIEPITDDSWDLICLPAYRIKLIDSNEIICVYPEEIFIIND